MEMTSSAVGADSWLVQGPSRRLLIKPRSAQATGARRFCGARLGRRWSDFAPVRNEPGENQRRRESLRRPALSGVVSTRNNLVISASHKKSRTCPTGGCARLCSIYPGHRNVAGDRGLLWRENARFWRFGSRGARRRQSHDLLSSESRRAPPPCLLYSRIARDVTSHSYEKPANGAPLRDWCDRSPRRFQADVGTGAARSRQ